MPNARPGRPATGRLAARWRHYVAFGALYVVVYGGLALAGRFPRWLLFGLLLVSLGKDLLDEYRLRRGGGPLVYAGIEHAPSDVVLLVLLLAGTLVPAGSFLGASAWSWAVLLAAVDLVLDVSQDLRAYSR